MANPGSSPAYTAVQQNLKWASAKHGATFTQGKLALPPSKKYLVLTCMDARIDPAQAFGINLGDAHVIRNVSSSDDQDLEKEWSSDAAELYTEHADEK